MLFFQDSKFKIKYQVDKRGRPINLTSEDHLNRYYAMSSSDESSDTEEEEDQKTKEDKNNKKLSATERKNELSITKSEKKKKKLIEKNQEKILVKSKKPQNKSDKNVKVLNGFKEEHSEEQETNSDESEEEKELDVKEKLKDLSLDYARGEGILGSDSSDDSDESSVEDEEDVSHPWGELDAEADKTDESTKRLAICNMDWDRIHAVDLMVLLNSFISGNGSIKSVTIYPSEFGLERMKEDEIRGPKEIVESKALDISDEEDDESDYQTEKLRQYQLNRLKYYYAVAVFDSVETASKVYEECDGMEYESSATKLDLRFIPDDMEFEHDPNDECTSLPDPTRYEPKFFVNSALQQAKVELTWEENDPLRKANMEKLFENPKNGKGANIDESVIRQYLATSSSEGEESDVENTEDNTGDANEDNVAKYRALLAEIDKPKEEKEMEMEITWGVGLKEKVEQLVEKKLSGKDKLTPWEQYLEKKREKRKQNREKTKLEETEGTSQTESEDDTPSDIDMNDPYFKEEFVNNPEFEKLKKKSKKKLSAKKNSNPEEGLKQQKAELELLLGDDDGRKHFSLKNILKNEESGKKKKKKKNQEDFEEARKEEDFKINVEDPRFSALFSSHHYNVDPSDQNFKKTKAMEVILAEKQKRRANINQEEHTVLEKRQKLEGKCLDPTLSNLVRRVKSKVNSASLKPNVKR
ncbi:hypothetical protein QYM36_015291 [Artemia franciscana]|uniref:NUC153 domain-containing protein n=1 Tax=Artemia franciscana TaxID=6661 RepID=A0AA88H8V5_ARTSF|nr:hypothetical protein QYM36_015291 [Artemia franciscana]